METNKINIEEEYRNYLKLVKLDEKKMPDVQRIETKRAFMTGFSQAALLIYREIAMRDEYEAVKKLDSILNQTADFWKSQR
jgi:hypothetical protein